MVSVKSQLKLAVCEATVSVTDGNVSPSTLNGGGAHREDRSDPIRTEPSQTATSRTTPATHRTVNLHPDSGNNLTASEFLPSRRTSADPSNEKKIQFTHSGNSRTDECLKTPPGLAEHQQRFHHIMHKKQHRVLHASQNSLNILTQQAAN